MSRAHVAIVESQQAESAFAARLQAILDGTTQVAIIAADETGLINVWNRGAERMLGYSAAEMIGRQTPAIFHLQSEVEEHGARLSREFGRPIAGFEVFVERARLGGFDEREWTYVRKDGQQLTVSLVVTALRNDAGGIIGYVGVAHNVTDHRRAKEAHALLANLVQSSDDAILAKSLDGIVLSWNAGAERLYGYTAAETVGQSIELVVPDDRRAEEQRLLATIRHGGRVTHFETQRLRKNGQLVDISLTLSPLHDAQGQVIAISAIGRDITERKRFEASLQQAKAKAEAANRAKSAFLANMSHEIRTPLNGILGLTQLVLDGTLSAQQREYLELVKQSGEALLTIINDVLDSAKIEAGKFALELQPFRLRDHLGQIVKSLAPRAHAKGLELSYYLQPDVPDSIIGDISRIRQIVVNLVGNAVKFTDQGEVALSVEVAAAEPRRATLHFQVRDTGIGIAADKQAQVFAAFEQADNSATRRHGGTGLGLHICQQLLGLMHGRLWLESTPGQGSTFHFEIPFELPAAQPEAPASPFKVAGQPVLIVEANDTTRQQLHDSFLRWHMKPVALASGAAALEELARAGQEQRPFALVLVDASRLDVDLLDFTRSIKRHPEWARGILLILSTTSDSNDRERGQALGVDGFLTKPVTDSELLDAVVDLLKVSLVKHLAQHPAAPAPRLTKGRVLLAEDNRVNQLVAVRFLEEFGCTVKVANNGQEAVDAAAAEDFDLVLMDVQMPVLSGLEATALLRAREAGTGAHLPIVAMTAHAMMGDRDTCLQAGMDGYLAKPFQPAELRRILDRFLTDRSTVHLKRPDTMRVKTSDALDNQATLAQYDDDAAFVQELVDLFRQDTPAIRIQLADALARGDTAARHKLAHRLKGSIAAFVAPAAYQAALDLEKLPADADAETARLAHQRLQTELDLLEKAFTEAKFGKHASDGDPV